jgi:hypothetical protein
VAEAGEAAAPPTAAVLPAIGELDETITGSSSKVDVKHAPRTAGIESQPDTAEHRWRLALGVSIGSGIALLLLMVLVVVVVAAGTGKPKFTVAPSGKAANPPPAGKYVKMATREDTVLATLQANGWPALTGKWHYLGPFDNTAKAGFAAVYPPEQTIDLKQAYLGKNNQQVKWQEALNFQPGRMHDIRKVLNHDAAVVYLYHEIEVPERTTLEISLGSDDTLTLWLNGQLLVSHNVERAAKPDQNFATLNLQPGRNQLLAKVCQVGGPWAFYVMPRWPVQLTQAFGANLDRDFPARLQP